MPAPSAPVAAPEAAGAERPRERTQAIGSLLVPGSVRLRYVVSGEQKGQPLRGVSAELVWLQDGKEYGARQSWGSLFATLRTLSLIHI